MSDTEKLCPFCAETIKAEAIRCKHCHADLAQETQPPGPAVSDRKLGFFPKLILVVLGLGAAFLAFGFLVSNTPEGKAKIQARDAIDLCHRQEGGYAGTAGAKAIISGACKKLENDFMTRFGHAP